MIARTEAQKAEQYRLLLATLESSNMSTGGFFVAELELVPLWTLTPRMVLKEAA